jgi:hypothetical protein
MSKLLTKFKRNAIDELINSVDNKKVSAATITTSGSGYSTNALAKTIVSTLGGTTFTVTANASGNATAVSLLSAGVYNSNVAANNIATLNTSGTGTGLTVNVSFIDENSYYVFVGGQSEYPTSNVTAESDSVETTYNTWNELMFGKKANFIRMTDKYVWTSNTVYTQYDDTVDLSDENFFVVTSARDVFKCIYNNNGAASTTEPAKLASKIGVPVKEVDGYEWLYLYTIDKSDYTKFVTANYMPVVANTLIANAAVDGGIFNIVVEVDGEDYPNHTGTITTTSNNSVIIIANTANTTSNYYKDSAITVANTSGSTFIRKIAASNTAYGITTTDLFPDDFLSNTCTYSIGPLLTITSRTGSNASAYAVMNSTTGAITRINMIQYGTGYKDATVSITAGSGLGSGAEARAIISPLGGHGSNVYDELHVDSLGVHCLFDEWGTGNTFNADVTYRTVGLLKNPTDVNGTLYTADTFNELATINISAGTGTFTYGEIVTGTISNSFGRFAYANSDVVLLTGTNGTFVLDEDIVGADSRARRTVTANSSAVDLKLYSGEVLYVQNIQEVTRSVSNKEQVKLVISF